MAHELMEHDNMVSVREVPWHGLGIILPDYIPVLEAQKVAGLTWSVRKEPVHYRMPAVDGMSRIMEIPGSFAIVRDDNQQPLGVVGANYTPYQNDQMFQFVDEFAKDANSQLETCGSLRNGRMVWALCTAGEVEYVKNDPVKKYFLIKNAFDGSSNIEVCFTDIRVVCNNTLTAALKGASNVWRIRHTSSLHEQMQAVKGAIELQRKHSDAMYKAMERMVAHKMTSAEIKRAATEIVMGDVSDVEELLQPGQDLIELATAHKAKVINTILNLHESGAGSNIPGVRGSAYGLLNACTEYADHFKTLRPGERSYSEARFESIMVGSASDFKKRAFDYTYALTA